MPNQFLKSCFQSHKTSFYQNQRLVFDEKGASSEAPQGVSVSKLEDELSNNPEGQKKAATKEKLIGEGKEAIREVTSQNLHDLAASIGVGKDVPKLNQAGNTPPSQNENAPDIGQRRAPKDGEKKEATSKAAEKLAEGPINPYAKIKKPPENAPSGREIIAKLKSMPENERQKYMVEQFRNGNLTIKFRPITTEIIGKDGKKIKATYYVSGPVALGKENPVYWPMSGLAASVAANEIGCLLPTSKVSLDAEKSNDGKDHFIPYQTVGYEAIIDQLGVPHTDADRYDLVNVNGRMEKAPRGNLMRNLEGYDKANDLLQAEMKKRGLQPGDDFYGATKEISIHPRIEESGNQAIFGGRMSISGKQGGIIQGTPGPHEKEYHDYTNKITHVVYGTMIIETDGKQYEVSTADVLKTGRMVTKPDGTREVFTMLGRNDLHRLLSKDGPMDVSKMYHPKPGEFGETNSSKVALEIPVREITSPSREVDTRPNESLPKVLSAKPSSSDNAPAAVAAVPRENSPAPTPSKAPSLRSTSAPELSTVSKFPESTPATPSSMPKNSAISLAESSSKPSNNLLNNISKPEEISIKDQPYKAEQFSGNGLKAKSAETPPIKTDDLSPGLEVSSRKNDRLPIQPSNLAENAPRKAYSVLGDSYSMGISGALKNDSAAREYFQDMNFHGEMSGKHTDWMKNQLEQGVIPKLAQKDATISIFGGINDVLAPPKNDEQMEKIYANVTQNLADMYELAHRPENKIKVVGVTIPPLGQYMQAAGYSAETRRRVKELSHRINEFMLSHEGQPNGPDKVVRLDLLMASSDNPEMVDPKFGVDKDKAMHLHPDQFGYQLMAAEIEKAIHDLQST